MCNKTRGFWRTKLVCQLVRKKSKAAGYDLTSVNDCSMWEEPEISFRRVEFVCQPIRYQEAASYDLTSVEDCNCAKESSIELKFRNSQKMKSRCNRVSMKGFGIRLYFLMVVRYSLLLSILLKRMGEQYCRMQCSSSRFWWREFKAWFEK